jgi:hypothetical protein
VRMSSVGESGKVLSIIIKVVVHSDVVSLATHSHLTRMT